MLPFSLKVVWFALCSTGTFGCWVVLLAMSKSLNVYWITMLYCIATTALEGIFCLGMLYRMDPFQMPEIFRLAQIFIISLSALVLTGICVAFIIATTAAILWPELMHTAPHATLAYRHVYIIPIAVVPIMVAVTQIVVVIKLDAAKPSDNLHADVTGPLWVSLLGYAGMPMLESIPCLFITLLSGFRIAKLHKAQQSYQNSYSRNRATSIENSTPAIYCSMVHNSDAMGGDSGDRIIPSTPLPLCPSTVIDSSYGKTSSFASQFSITPHHSPSLLEFPFHPQEEKVQLSPKATTLIANSTAVHLADLPTERSVPLYAPFLEEPILEPAEEGKPIDQPQQSTLRWDPASRPSRITTAQKKIVPLIWRLILFHATFFSIQILVTTSTLVDVIRKRHTPTPFGTQHVALVLAAWGPVIVFSHSPGIRQKLNFWRQWSNNRRNLNEV